jgi:monoamine oxidase
MATADCDVLVVGGGLTGLVAATRRAGHHSVIVLEGRDRLGGRTETRTESGRDGDTYFDFGAHFIGHERAQDNIWNLVTKELELEVFPQYEGPEGFHPPPSWAGEAANLLSHRTSAGAKTEAYVGQIYPQHMGADAVMAELEALFAGAEWFDLEKLPPFLDLDETVDDWARYHFVGKASIDEVRDLLDMLCRVGLSARSRDVSLVFFLFYIASSGGLARFSNVRFPSQGAQGYRLRKGAMAISDKLGANLRAAGGDIRLGHRVVKLDFTADPGVAICENGSRVSFRTALVAMAPPLANKIDMTPPLPKERVEAAGKMRMGQTVMTCIHVRKPFWRCDTTRYSKGHVGWYRFKDISRYGLSGAALIAGDTPIVWTMDNVSAEGDPALFAFVVADWAERWRNLPETKRQAIVLDQIGDLFGHDAIRDNFVRYEEKDWTIDPFSAGCPACHFGAGDFTPSVPWVMTGHMPAFQDDRLFFASTESAKVSNGYMSGAMWAGEETAKLIAASLERRSSTAVR